MSTVLPAGDARNAPAVDVSNSQFLAAVFARDETAWIASFRESPATENPGKWLGRPQRVSARVDLPADANNYIATASIRPGGRRRLIDAQRMPLLVADDADADALTAPPSYILETSPGKFQVGFILDDSPETRDVPTCQAAIAAMVRAKLVPKDRSGNNPTRYVRLPVGTNTKPRDSGPFAHRMRVWRPELRYTLDAALRAFGVKPDEIATPSAASDDLGELSLRDVGFDLSAALADIISGESQHPIMRAAASLAARGMTAEAAIDVLAAIVEQSAARTSEPQRWAERQRDIPRTVASAFAKFSAQASAAKGIEPADFFASVQAPAPWEPDVLPPIVSALAQCVARRLGVDPHIPAIVALVVAGALAGSGHRVRVKRHDGRWTEAPQLWAAIVADPSAKKSPAIAEVMEPVDRLQARFHAEHVESMRIWQMRAAEARREKQIEPEPPTRRRVVVNDATVEAIGAVVEANPDGVLAMHDELSGFFGSMDAYRQQGASKDRPFWLIAYNGGPHHIDRAGGKEPRYIPHLSVSVLGGIQPEPMRQIAAKGCTDDGLLQRFLVIPARASGTGADVSPDHLAHAEWDACVRLLADLDAPDRPYTLDDDAQAVLDEARAKVHRLGAHPGFDSRLRTALQKGEGQLARLVLVFHLLIDRSGVDLFTGECIPGPVVSADTARRGAQFFHSVLVPATVAFYSAVVGAGTGLQDAREAAGYILAHRREKIAARDLYRAQRAFRDDDGRRRLVEALAQLELAGWVTPVPRPYGRPPSEWIVNPRVHVVFAARAAQERERREQARSAIEAAAGEMSRLSLTRAEGENGETRKRK
ncbi:MAG: DUF3987 domain-containing protein [Burkholderiaceae bacterium]|jgi:hypothetical protein|nr:DUF3987 domain-containing protein [Burkholderiaceae bacterium]